MANALASVAFSQRHASQKIHQSVALLLFLVVTFERSEYRGLQGKRVNSKHLGNNNEDFNHSMAWIHASRDFRHLRRIGG